ncbi:hypothetical protein GDO78_013624 [Eleutherodactylus coqui]|uniref:Uncharacterized protein n=1 Tax=Eleutherodactylus coqui TaxID=57060 RepID=A0A8J6BFL0_ELECQ|nr:hypothetical protein GDO78_013624 [Eleutherodactylus coqui]
MRLLLRRSEPPTRVSPARPPCCHMRLLRRSEPPTKVSPARLPCCHLRLLWRSEPPTRVSPARPPCCHMRLLLRSWRPPVSRNLLLSASLSAGLRLGHDVVPENGPL